MERGQLDFESAMNNLQGRQTSEALHFYSIILLEQFSRLSAYVAKNFRNSTSTLHFRGIFRYWL